MTPSYHDDTELFDEATYESTMRKELLSMPQITAPDGFEERLRAALREGGHMEEAAPASPRLGFFRTFRSWPAIYQGAVAASFLMVCSFVVSQFSGTDSPTDYTADPLPEDRQYAVAPTDGRDTQIPMHTLAPDVATETSPAASTSPTPAPAPEATSPEMRTPPDDVPEARKAVMQDATPPGLQPVENSATRGGAEVEDSVQDPRKSAIDRRLEPDGARISREPSSLRTADTTRTARKAEKDSTARKPAGTPSRKETRPK